MSATKEQIDAIAARRQAIADFDASAPERSRAAAAAFKSQIISARRLIFVDFRRELRNNQIRGEKAMTNETKNVALVVGWKRDGVEIPTPDGIHAEDYFRDGQYLGPDADGVEPIFRA